MAKKVKWTKERRAAFAATMAAKKAAKKAPEPHKTKLPGLEYSGVGFGPSPTPPGIHAASKALKAKSKVHLVWSLGASGEETYHLTAPGYDMLAAELSEAFAQSAHGKGKERHANNRPFDRQPILELGRLYGPGFATGQAAKKAQEALGMLHRGQRSEAIFELHGAIVYLAAAAGLIREGDGG